MSLVNLGVQEWFATWYAIIMIIGCSFGTWQAFMKGSFNPDLI